MMMVVMVIEAPPRYHDCDPRRDAHDRAMVVVMMIIEGVMVVMVVVELRHALTPGLRCRRCGIDRT
jgi:hypothetical protein